MWLLKHLLSIATTWRSGRSLFCNKWSPVSSFSFFNFPAAKRTGSQSADRMQKQTKQKQAFFGRLRADGRASSAMASSCVLLASSSVGRRAILSRRPRVPPTAATGRRNSGNAAEKKPETQEAAKEAPERWASRCHSGQVHLAQYLKEKRGHLSLPFCMWTKDALFKLGGLWWTGSTTLFEGLKEQARKIPK